MNNTIMIQPFYSNLFPLLKQEHLNLRFFDSLFDFLKNVAFLVKSLLDLWCFKMPLEIVSGHESLYTASLKDHFRKISLFFTWGQYSKDLLWQEELKPLSSDSAHMIYLTKVSKF